MEDYEKAVTFEGYKRIVASLLMLLMITYFLTGIAVIANAIWDSNLSRFICISGVFTTIVLQVITFIAHRNLRKLKKTLNS